MTRPLTITVQFPDGIRTVPAFECPDHDMYAGMPGRLILTPSPLDGYRFVEKLGAGGMEWHATPKGLDDATKALNAVTTITHHPDNIFSPGPRPSESLDNPTPHNFSCGGGYLSNWCCKCNEEAYPTDAVFTDFCEDRDWGKAQFAFEKHESKLKAERRHAATEGAIARARKVLSAEDWDLLGIKVAPYRDVDYLKI